MQELTTSDGVRLRYVTEGREDGPPLVFANALAADLSMWDGQAHDAAGRGFRVVRYDQRGHGGSAAPPGEYTLERLAQDLLELLNALQLEQAAFCGLSLGGMTGIWAAMRHPRRFSRLALCNTAVWMPPRDMWEERIESVGRRGMAAVADATVARWLTEPFRRREPDLTGRIRDMILATEPAGYAGCCAAVRDMDQRDRLGLIETPTLVVVGAQDPSTPPERGQYIVNRIPGARKAELDTAHLSNVEARDEFNAAVLGFMAGERP